MSFDKPFGPIAVTADELDLDRDFDPWCGFYEDGQSPCEYYIDEDEESKCDGCGKQWQSSGDAPAYCLPIESDENDEAESALQTLCESCANAALPDIIDEAKRYAETTIEFRVDRLHVFNPLERFAPTPEEYNRGDREAYTKNSVRAVNRHNATNYDDLIAPLSRNNLRDRVYYLAIRYFADAVIAEATDKMAAAADRQREEESA